MVVLFGASGHAKEILYILRKCTNGAYIRPAHLIAGAMDTSIEGIPILSEQHFSDSLQSSEATIVAYLAIGNGSIRKKIVEKFLLHRHLVFPNLLSHNIEGDFDHINFGIGNIMFPNSQFTTNINIGDHNHFNLNVSISHDAKIGDFNTFSPGVRIAGQVSIGKNNFFGVNSSVIDKVSIGDNVVIGAGAVVVDDIIDSGTYVGVPAKKIK